MSRALSFSLPCADRPDQSEQNCQPIRPRNGTACRANFDSDRAASIFGLQRWETQMSDFTVLNMRRTIFAVVVSGLLTLAGCGGGSDIDETIQAAGQVPSSQNTGSTTKTLAEEAATPDRPPPLTEAQLEQGVSTAYACTSRTLTAL